MSNTTLTADIIAKEAVMILENNCVMAKLVHRGYESEFDNNVNGYKPGETVSIRRPADFTVRRGAVASVQDVVEGKTSVTVDIQDGVDFKFSSQDLTLQIGDLSERVIKPAMIQLCNTIDREVMSLYKYVPQQVVIPSGGMNSFADFGLAPRLMDKMAIPQDGRAAVLSPDDHWDLVGSQTALYMQGLAKSAYETAKLGMIGGCDTYMSQNTPTHTTGDRTGTDLIDLPIVDGTFTWATVKDSTTITIHMDGFAAATSTAKTGDTFTISDVYDVNPVSKAPLAHLKQFVVMSDFTAASSEGDILIWPPIILSGSHKTCHLGAGTDINDNTVTWRGVASTSYAESLFFRKEAFALTMVPMIKPPGAVDVGRRSYKGCSVRVIPYYNGTNDDSSWRLDVLYGVDLLDSRQAVRASLAADI
jgi:hypothetical protein